MKRALVFLLVAFVIFVSSPTFSAGLAGGRIYEGDGKESGELPSTTTDPLGTQIDPWQYKVDEHTYYVYLKDGLWGLMRLPTRSDSSSSSGGGRNWSTDFLPGDWSEEGGNGNGGDGRSGASGLLFNDFERWTRYQGNWVPTTTNLGGLTGPMSPDLNGDGRGDYDPTLTRVGGHDGRYALQMSYSFPQDQWCGFWMFANDGDPDRPPHKTIDVSGYTDIQLWVREGRPLPPGDPMKIELKDLAGNMHAVYLYMVPGFEDGPTQNWQKAVIPLPVFSGVDMSRLRMVNIVFDYPGRGSISGIVQVDTIKFTRQSSYTYPSGLVIDAFNDGRGPNEMGGGAGVAKPAGSSVTIAETYVQDGHEGLGGLRLDYNIGSKWAAYWNFMYPENWRGRDVSDQNSLQLWAKGARGGEKFKIEVKDTSGHVYKIPITRISGFENGLSRSYRKIAVPLSVFSSNGINLRKILQVNIVFDEAPTSGRVFIDLLRFSTEHAPPLLNERPVAWINSITPNPADGGETVRFEGNGRDSDGSVVRYEWSSSIDGVFASGAFTSPVVVTRDNLSPGVHTIYFRVKDDRGDWSEKDNRRLTIRSVTQPPVANIQTVPDPPQGTAPLTVNFSASESYDPDGGALTYLWDFGDGNSNTDENTVHTYSTPGSYTAVLTVTDDEGDSDSASVDVWVFPENCPPVAVLNTTPNPPRGLVPLTVQCYGENSYDPDGYIVSYFWDFGDGENSDNVNPVHTYTSPGDYRLLLVVTDNSGLTDGFAVMVRAISADNVLVRITPESQEVASGEPFTVDVYVEPSAPVAGMQLKMSFDPSLVRAEDIEEGDFLSSGGTTFFNDNENNIINNAGGWLENVWGLIIDGSTSTPGTFVRVHMKALENVEGISMLVLGNVKVSGPGGENLPALVMTGEVIVVLAPPWDINGDHVVDIFDLVLVASHFGETGLPGWIREDVNRDGVIDIFDLVIVASHFGETW